MEKQSGKDSSVLNEQVKRILRDIDLQKETFKKKGMNFTALNEEQLRRKLSRAHSPMIIGQGWGGTVPPGGTLTYNVSIHNPDPAGWVWLFGHVFFGPANMIPSIGEALEVADPRFPRLTQPGFDGLRIATNDTATMTYSIPIPTGIQPTNYQGNIFLYQADWHDVGDYLDRGTFVFTVT